MNEHTSSYVSTTNACKLCKPLGACLAFRGIQGSVPFLHGSQGCATYMRRYIISHFREPMDIASSSLGEKQAVYGGEANLKQGLSNVMDKYDARFIGVATTCLTETIGDDVTAILKSYKHEQKMSGKGRELPILVNVATPSYSGTHMEGFHAAVKAIIEQAVVVAAGSETVNLLPGFVSPADIRYLKEIMEDFDIKAVILPDLSETLDGPAVKEYEKIPCGGTPIKDITDMGGARCTIELGRALVGGVTGGVILRDRFDVPLHQIGTPIGLRETDRFFKILTGLAGGIFPLKHDLERGRLVDSYVDAHKYVFGKRAVVYGEEDLVVGLTAFLSEIGIRPVLCATGGRSGKFEASINAVTDGILDEIPFVREGEDFYDIGKEAEELAPDLFIGHSKGYHLARRLEVPLIRVGFPIHDRFGAQRTLHVGYRGAQSLLDRIVDALIETKQELSQVGYGYI